MFKVSNFSFGFLPESFEWVTISIAALFMIFTITLLVNYLVARKTVKKLSSDYTELLDDFNRVKEDLQNKSRQISSMSLHVMTVDNNVEKFIKRASNNLQDMNQLKLEIRQFSRELRYTKQSLESIELLFNNIHPEFFRSIEEKHPKISKQDLKLLAFLKMNLTNKEISNVMNVTTGAVFQSKRRLKKKLGLKPEEKLRQFLLSFEENGSGYQLYAN